MIVRSREESLVVDSTRSIGIGLFPLLLVGCGGAIESGPTGAGDAVEPAAVEVDAGQSEEKAESADAGPGAGVASPGTVSLDPVTCDPPSSIDEPAVDAHFEGLLPAFGECYAQALEKAPGVDGKYVIQVIFSEQDGKGRSGGYFYLMTGFLVGGLKECLGEHLLTAEVDTPPEAERVTCELVLHFSPG
jgi:hypothetical protein